MNLLIHLKVRYGFPVNALYGFLKYNDHETWRNYLKGISCEICINQQEGCIYLFVKNCPDAMKVRKDLTELPLVKEEFVDMVFHEFASFKSLSCLFESAARIAV